MILGDGEFGTIRGRVKHQFVGNWWPAARFGRDGGDECTYFICYKVRLDGDIELDQAGRPQVCCFRRIGNGEVRAMRYNSDLLGEILRLKERLEVMREAAGAA